MLGQRVLRAVDDPQIFPASALHGRLHETPSAFGNKLQGLGYHALAATVREVLPPSYGAGLALGIGDIHHIPRRGQQ